MVQTQKKDKSNNDSEIKGKKINEINNENTNIVNTKQNKQNKVMSKVIKNIGIPITNPPKNVCNDPKCPYHGSLKVRKKTYEGLVISDKMDKTVTVRWQRLVKIKKYERYEKRYSKVKAHNPPCINAKLGDYVRIAETRPLSKTKHFVVIEILKSNENK